MGGEIEGAIGSQTFHLSPRPLLPLLAVFVVSWSLVFSPFPSRRARLIRRHRLGPPRRSKRYSFLSRSRVVWLCFSPPSCRPDGTACRSRWQDAKACATTIASWTPARPAGDFFAGSRRPLPRACTLGRREITEGRLEDVRPSCSAGKKKPVYALGPSRFRSLQSARRQEGNRERVPDSCDMKPIVHLDPLVSTSCGRMGGDDVCNSLKWLTRGLVIESPAARGRRWCGGVWTVPGAAFPRSGRQQSCGRKAWHSPCVSG